MQNGLPSNVERFDDVDMLVQVELLPSLDTEEDGLVEGQTGLLLLLSTTADLLADMVFNELSLFTTTT